jgi:hypothetical protein
MELGFDKLTLRGRLDDVTVLGSNRPGITETYEVDSAELHEGLYNRFYGVTVKRIRELCFEFTERNNAVLPKCR